MKRRKSCRSKRSKPSRPEIELPSEPEWDDVLPRLCESPHSTLPVGVSVPGGEIVASFAKESLAREFIGWLGAQYVARAEMTLRALDELAAEKPRDVAAGPAPRITQPRRKEPKSWLFDREPKTVRSAS